MRALTCVLAVMVMAWHPAPAQTQASLENWLPQSMRVAPGRKLESIPDPAPTLEGAQANEAFNWHVQILLGSTLDDPKHLPEFEARWKKWIQTARKGRDGIPSVTKFDFGVSGFFSRDAFSPDHSKLVDRLLKTWPNQPSPHLIKAAWHLASAWEARGSDTSNAVSKPAMERYLHHSAQARKVLNAAPAAARDFPLWYTLKLTSWLDGAFTAADVMKTLTEATEKFPGNPSFYFNTLTLIMPQYYGSYPQAGAFVNWALERPLPDSKNEIYARLAWSFSAHGNDPVREFKAAGIQWPKVRLGFDEMMKRYPDSLWNLNNYAYLACRMNDRATFLRLKESVRVNMVPNAWRQGYTFEDCSALLAKAM